MGISRFEGSPIGRLVPVSVRDGGTTWEHFAYVPYPLPEKPRLADETIQAVIDATGAVNRLDGAGRRLPNPYLLSRPAFYEEAVSTSALEGTYATIDEVFEADLLDADEVSPDVAEVRNYVLAAMRGLELIEELPICRRLVLDIHRILMAGEHGDHPDAGQIRSRQNWIGKRRHAPITESVFVPPPAPVPLEDGLDQWERWINRPEIPTLVRAALGHYQFETLHPFIDGNGRVGRLVATLQLIAEGELTVPLLNISPYLAERKDEYLEGLRCVTVTGDWDPWVQFFCEAVRVQAGRALERAEALLVAREELVAHVREANLRGVAIEITENLIGYPVVSPTQAAKDFGVSYQTANRAIGNLVDAGVLREVTGKNYGRIFASTAILKILSGNLGTS